MKEKKIHLLLCFVKAHIGGAMTSLVNFLNALDTDKYDVDVMFYEMEDSRYGIKPEINILPQGKVHEQFGMMNILRKLCSPAYVRAAALGFYYEKIRKNERRRTQLMSKQGCRYSRSLDKEYDVAVAYEFNWCMNYVMRRVKAKRKILWHHMDYGKSGMDYRIDRKEMEAADALVFVSSECRDNFLKAHPEHAAKSRYIPNMLSSAYVRARGEADVSLPFEKKDGQLVFVTVARISFEEKGFDRAVNAFARLKQDGLLGNVRWLIIGDGEDMNAMRRMIREAGLEDVIYPIGTRTNPIPYLKHCDVFLLPSRHEGKPMAITEGFIMGLVPVVTEYSSAREQIRHGVDGLVFDNDDEALYCGLKELLENPSVIKDLQAEIRRTDYGNEKEIAAFDRLVEELL